MNDDYSAKSLASIARADGRRPLLVFDVLLAILLLSAALWAAIWGIVAFPLASMLP